MAGAIQNHHAQLLNALAEALREFLEVLGRGGGNVDGATSERTDSQFFHVDAGAGIEHCTPFREGDDGDGPLATLGRQSCSINRVNGNVGGDSRSVADFLAVVEPRRFVLFAFTNDDDAVHLHGVEGLAHGIDGDAIRGVLVAPAHKAGGRQRTGLSHADEVKGEVSVGRGGAQHLISLVHRQNS